MFRVKTKKNNRKNIESQFQKGLLKSKYTFSKCEYFYITYKEDIKVIYDRIKEENWYNKSSYITALSILFGYSSFCSKFGLKNGNLIYRTSNMYSLNYLKRLLEILAEREITDKDIKGIGKADSSKITQEIEKEDIVISLSSLIIWTKLVLKYRLTYNIVINLLDRMEGLKMITQCIGHRTYDRENNITSSVATQYILNPVKEWDIKYLFKGDNLDKLEYLEFLLATQNIYNSKKRKKAKDSLTVKDRRFNQNMEVKDKKSKEDDYREALCSKRFHVLYNVIKKVNEKFNHLNKYLRDKLNYYRVYTDGDTNKGGRFYNALTSVSKEIREMVMEFYRLEEIDFKSFMFNAFYHLIIGRNYINDNYDSLPELVKSLYSNDDAYIGVLQQHPFIGIMTEAELKYYRKLIKAPCIVVINTKNVIEAIGATNNIFKKENVNFDSNIYLDYNLENSIHFKEIIQSIYELSKGLCIESEKYKHCDMKKLYGYKHILENKHKEFYDNIKAQGLNPEEIRMFGFKSYKIETNPTNTNFIFNLEKAHSQIKLFFYCLNYGLYQKIESDITMYMHLLARKENDMLFSVHDAIIVEEDKIQKYKDYMPSVFHTVYSNDFDGVKNRDIMDRVAIETKLQYSPEIRNAFKDANNIMVELVKEFFKIKRYTYFPNRHYLDDFIEEFLNNHAFVRELYEKINERESYKNLSDCDKMFFNFFYYKYIKLNNIIHLIIKYILFYKVNYLNNKYIFNKIYFNNLYLSKSNFLYNMYKNKFFTITIRFLVFESDCGVERLKYA